MTRLPLLALALLVGALALPRPGDAPPEVATDAGGTDAGGAVVRPVEIGDVALPEVTVPVVRVPIAEIPVIEPEAPRVSYDGLATGRTLVNVAGRRVPASGIPHLDTLLAYEGVVEVPRNSNRGRYVDRFIRQGGRLDPPQPWCAALTSYAVRESGAELLDASGRSVLSALARTATRAHTFIPYARVAVGAEVVLPGDLVVWGYPRSTSGHIGAAVRDDHLTDPTGRPYERPDGSCFETIEGNTSAGANGSQRDGGGVYRRVRCGATLGGMRLLGFARPTYGTPDGPAPR
ncbi:MAG: hypothetical protein CMM85_20430 [Rhodothermaceae bacterium]|nr:hypothetical protein [Rhodothermaceae bacterium]